MQDAQTLSRCLLPPGRVTTCTVWTLGSHRRLVRRWECDTDLPKPGPFPQISHTAAMMKLLKCSGVRRLAHREPGPAQAAPGPIQDTDCPGEPPKRSTTGLQLTTLLSPPLARLNRPVRPAGGWWLTVTCRTCRRRATLAPTGAWFGKGARRWVTVGTSDRLLDASTLRDWAHTAVSDLITHIDEINRLNVFPVADSDTGANMLFTMRSALAEANAGASADGGPGCVARAASALSAGALNGARGNSGVILSQILRGIADVTATAAADAGGELPQMDAVLLGAALRRGVELVIISMGGQEVPGTIVSVLRAAAGAVEECAAEGLATAIIAGSDAAVVALEKTTEQLDVLADAGAVDAGGRGLLVLLDALSSTVTGQTSARTVYELSPRAGPAEAVTERPGPQFEVMYLLDGCDAAAADVLRDRLEELGESVAIAAAPSDSYSVHVHTDDAGAAVEAGLVAGQVSRIVVSALS